MDCIEPVVADGDQMATKIEYNNAEYSTSSDEEGCQKADGLLQLIKHLYSFIG